MQENGCCGALEHMRSEDSFNRFCTNLRNFFYLDTFGSPDIYRSIDIIVSLNQETFMDFISVFGPNLGRLTREIKIKQGEYIYPKVVEFVNENRYLLNNNCFHCVDIGDGGQQGCLCEQAIMLSGVSYTGCLPNGFGVEHGDAIIKTIWPD